METSYSPVPYEFRELIEQKFADHTRGKVFYFNTDGKFDEASGSITNYEEVPGKGTFITLDHTLIRIDRIITLFGKPGAAFDEYDAFGNACLDCKGGYDFV